MFRNAAFAVLTAALLGVSACAPLAYHNGFMAIEANPADVKVGDDTRSTVMAKLGTPSATSTFDKNTWFYMSQMSTTMAYYKPRLQRREVTAIAFDPNTEQVKSVNNYTLRDGRVIAYNGRETPTRGREMTILEQLLGNIGNGSVLPNDQDTSPGSHPDDRH